MHENFTLDIGANANIIKAADKLRQIVFIDEQGIPEEEIVDGLNLQTIHIVVFDNSEPIATARLLNNNDSNDSWRIGLVAVDKSRRGQHFGEKVMKAAIEYINLNDGREILLTSQQQICGFYEKLGFAQCGEAKVFESGFVLVPMRLCLEPV